jgi:F0F1-type ATP synthase assembly protein I
MGEAGMPDNQDNPKELGYYFALGQIGMEMVVPMVVGIALDHYLDWRPWATVIGLIVGFVGGMTHLILLVSRHDKAGPTRPHGDRP